MSQILVFGDSIAYGAWDIEGGWAERLKKEISKKVIATNYLKIYKSRIISDCLKTAFTLTPRAIK